MVAPFCAFFHPIADIGIERNTIKACTYIISSNVYCTCDLAHYFMDQEINIHSVFIVLTNADVSFMSVIYRVISVFVLE